jgi:hypothetical protein
VEPGLAFPTIKAHGLLAASDPIQLIDLAKRGILAALRPRDPRPTVGRSRSPAVSCRS